MILPLLGSLLLYQPDYHLLDNYDLTSGVNFELNNPNFNPPEAPPQSYLVLIHHENNCIEDKGFLATLEDLLCTQFKGNDCLCISVGASLNDPNTFIQITQVTHVGAIPNILFESVSINLEYLIKPKS